MNKRRGHSLSLMLLIGFAASACAAPSLFGPAPEVPPVDDLSLATMISGTAAALGTQTAQAIPTAAATATATRTAGPTATRLPTLTPEPTQVSLQSTLTIRENNSTLFVDPRGGYELVVPAGWLAVRVNEAEYFESLDLLESAAPEVQKAFASIVSEDPAIMRLFAFDVQPDHVRNGVVSTIAVQWNERDAMSLDTDADLQAEAGRLRGMIPNAEVLSVEVRVPAGGLQHGLISARWPLQTQSGNVVMYQKQAFFKFGEGRLVITLSTVEPLKDTLLPGFDEMVEGVKVAAP